MMRRFEEWKAAGRVPQSLPKCSFCDKARDEVAYMAGRAGTRAAVNICDSCIDLLTDALADFRTGR
jgi:hypothetical protein